MTTETAAAARVPPGLMRERSAHLALVAAELKTELFGIDGIIDRVIESIRAWYVLPHIIRRPVIVCLWGLTGTGKTQLTRRLAQKLGFYDRFVEVQMDGFSNGGSWRSADSISAMLAESGVAEGEPGMLVLDEFQRFRTVNEKGGDLAVKRYQDVWQLLSDGRLPPSLSFLQELESSLAFSLYDHEREEADEKPEKDGALPKKLKFALSPYQAQEFRQSLKLKEPLQEVMTWTPQQLQERMLAFRASTDSWETDYSRLLIFVSGNLDEMYEGTAKRVEDCDTDADIFHALTKKLSVIDVKKALGERFKPEQIARLGNNHVIYPSLSQSTYERLIRSTCARYVDEMQASAGLVFDLHESVYQGIYANAVFPAQGTRPLFSSIHAILSAPLVNAALWALEHGIAEGATLRVRLDATTQSLHVSHGKNGGASIAYPVPLDLNQLKQRASPDFRALLAVHEAGHGLVYGRLFGHAPQEVKINVASFEGGYNSYVRMKAESRQSCLDRICVSLAGRAAEALVFGDDACTTGSESDFKNATALAARFVRHFGFGKRLSRIDVTDSTEENLNTDVEPTNAEIEALLAQAYARAQEILKADSALLLGIVDELLAHGQVGKEKMASLLGVAIAKEEQMLAPYAEQLRVFGMQHELMRRVRGEAVMS
ncbi:MULTISPECIES: AAA family ATPase [unclassified Polaromonas]|uniref:AAA family ATPase n=1 Tax=unclassified Polaromonas TaxID=2638319 RepID=UPI001E596D07|nr:MULTISPECIES: AAA family ATPase [unclassified Polaromonas]